MRSHTLALLLKNNIDDIEAIRIYLNFGRILRKCPPASLEVPVDIEKSTGIASGAGGLTTDIHAMVHCCFRQSGCVYVFQRRIGDYHHTIEHG